MSFFNIFICGSTPKVTPVSNEIQQESIEGVCESNREGIPSKYLDPLSHTILNNPFTGEKCHHTFSASSLRERFKQTKHSKCPVAECREKKFFQNKLLDGEIQNYILKNFEDLSKISDLGPEDQKNIVWIGFLNQVDL
jgi:hypothetical protein